MAAAHVAYAFTDAAAIYPITPSSPMADSMDLHAVKGQKNIFGRTLTLTELESEAGAAGTLHGMLQAGALSTTFTSSQGLLLMIPNMYKIAGELLPAVIHVAARTVTTHALSIFGDHSDIYACRQTGFAMLASANVQEVMDLGAAAHLCAIKSRVPFMHFFDGFRTSHEIQKVRVWDYEELYDMCDHNAVAKFRARALNPDHPSQRGMAQNPDTFFQMREACNSFYNSTPQIVADCLDEINRRRGTSYKLFDYYGDPEAEHIIVAMGSVCDTVKESVDYLNSLDEKVGLLQVRLYRPFSYSHLYEAIPRTVKYISVLDRTKEPGAPGEPLFVDISSAMAAHGDFRNVQFRHGRYGLASKDVVPGDIISVFHNTEKVEFTLGIYDDVTELSLPRADTEYIQTADITSCKFWGLGSDGTVGANKNSVKIIGDNSDMYVQAYFEYDSKKSGGLTVSHLRFGKNPIRSHYQIKRADFVACHNPAFMHSYNIIQELNEGGTFLLNCSGSRDELEKLIPGQAKRYAADMNIKIYTINASKIAAELGLGMRVNTILQSSFFRLSQIIPTEDAVRLMKNAATASYSKKGADIVELNHRAIDKGISELREFVIPPEWANAENDAFCKPDRSGSPEVLEFVNSIQKPVSLMRGHDLPVSTFEKYADGTVPNGTSAYEKRGIAHSIPVWIKENCIQCNFCSFVCPHAVIRPYVLDDSSAAESRHGDYLTPMNSLDGYRFGIVVSAYDCTSCTLCASVCPGKKGEKALVMKPLSEHGDCQHVFDEAMDSEVPPAVCAKFKLTTVKGSQFQKPLYEFSGACAGCGETPYAKLATQLFGDRMYIANATGCSSIWGGSFPSTAYTVNKYGKGPAWANSLFEDNAEFGYGLMLGYETLRERAVSDVKVLAEETQDDAVADACKKYLGTLDDSRANGEAADGLVSLLKRCDRLEKSAKMILSHKDFMAKKSHWLFGGDGWAYDIGYGGLDHVLASGLNINVLVFDTEVYSNTGGQASKATPMGAVAQFAAAGKATRKKDLAAMAMTYGYVYVSQVSMGADFNQCIKAFVEAESYPGPSLIIAYSPCISHGIKGGMKNMLAEQKRAVECGYYHLFRYNPSLEQPFTLDSKSPTADYFNFVENETRYESLIRNMPERAEKLLEQAAKDSAEKYARLEKLAGTSTTKRPS